MTKITIQDLGMAYRKAKADLYYSSNASLSAIADYEDDLHANLTKLLKKINARGETWVEQSEFIGDWTVVTKAISLAAWEAYKAEHGNGIVVSSPSEEWKQAIRALADQDTPVRPRAEFRVMSRCSLDFHVLSSLWLLKVGHLFDAKLDDCAYGNRLRRTKDKREMNALSLGSFHRYLMPFCNWRDNGIKAMRAALDADKDVVALTADVSSFYHELNPDFMEDDRFVNDVLGLELDAEQGKLHRLFVRALRAWAEQTPLKKGIPVGLPASAVVANVALIELDRVIEHEVAPLYYGRYVDDIILVMENGAGFQSMEELWEWLFARSRTNKGASALLGWAEDSETHGAQANAVVFKPAYLADNGHPSTICFANNKNKVFVLNGESGKAMVAAIEHEIHQRASEWRAMPLLPRSADNVATDLLVATEQNGEAADNLRKADALTMRRASFAIKLRDFEAYERDLPPDAWKAHRAAFFRAVTEHVLVLPQFFDLAIYLPRIVRLATACEDFEALRRIVDAVGDVFVATEKNCELSIKAQPTEEPSENNEIMQRWRDQTFTAIRESIASSMPFHLSKQGKRAWQLNMADLGRKLDLTTKADESIPASMLQKRHTRLFSYDLAHRPFRSIGLPRELASRRGVPPKKSVRSCDRAEDLVVKVVANGVSSLAQWARLKGTPHGLLFATRPFNLTELYLANRDACKPLNDKTLEQIVKAVRGFELSQERPTFDKHGDLHVPAQEIPTKIAVGVSSWKTGAGSWVAAVTRDVDPDIHRYERLCRLINEVISKPRRSRYLVLPELGLPAQWFLRVARKLQGRGISLITGIEYLHGNKKRVHNQVWAALIHDGLGFPSLMVYRQDKQRPALHEEAELHRVGGRKLQPAVKWKHGRPPVISHGEFCFAMLVCSELTNITYRAALRGRVDALFVPEWNQDTETFNALVESAALDIHAYIIQCNDRAFGDSRIRAPSKDSWRRDVLRVRGGVNDYCVVGEIDTYALRRFQSSHRSPSKPFKPVPDGFEIDYARKVLPMS